ncbi:MAG TPA: hypothetical protein VLJ57_07725 [Burkholderiaceae bacterium]|nr:hypothetical protein [Burkholderiaceae bacterium]
MYIVVIAWIYVALMMGVAEATNTNGTVLGAIVTFLLYGFAPVALVVYLMGSPARRNAIKAREAADRAIAEPSANRVQPDAGSETAAAAEHAAVAPVREKS